MSTWFTSDTHFFHRNVVIYCQRPFVRLDDKLVRPIDISEAEEDIPRIKAMVDVDAMNKHLVSAWNSIVKPGDDVYHLGDFAFGPKAGWTDILSGLNGNKILVAGNHDGSPSAMLRAGFNVVHKFGTPHILELDGCRLLLNHYPLHQDTWPAGITYHLCGHVHDEWVRNGATINVGVDVRDYKPVSLAQLLA